MVSMTAFDDALVISVGYWRAQKMTGTRCSADRRRCAAAVENAWCADFRVPLIPTPGRIGRWLGI